MAEVKTIIDQDAAKFPADPFFAEFFAKLKQSAQIREGKA